MNIDGFEQTQEEACIDEQLQRIADRRRAQQLNNLNPAVRRQRKKDSVDMFFERQERNMMMMIAHNS